MSKIKSNTIKKNVVLSIVAQMISLLVSCVLNLIVPKFIDEMQYAYWQTYVLYVSYVGILHFGLLDGIVLRYSQYDYDELNKAVLRSQFLILTIITTISAVIIAITTIEMNGQATKTIVVLIAIGVITKNVFTYTSYTFQITNRINGYVRLVISQRLFYGIGVLLLIVFGLKAFWLFCAMDLLADVLGVLLGARSNQGLYFGSLPERRVTMSELKLNMISGMMLLIANWSSMFVVGSARMIVQWHWDLLTFGKVSFAFSMSGLFLAFVTAASVVLFPSLKRMDEEQLPGVYRKIRNSLSPALFMCMIGYYPGCYILHLWLPAYENSLFYLGILLPIIVFTSKINLLTNNYLKAYRKERNMLIINLFSVLIAVTAFVLCAYVFNNLNALLVCVVFAEMMRSIVSEIVVTKIIRINITIDILMETALTLLFIVITWYFSLPLGCVIYSICFVIYLFINRVVYKNGYFK